MNADLMTSLYIRTSYVFAFASHAMLAGILANFWRKKRPDMGLGWWVLDGLQLSIASLLLLAWGKLPPWLILVGSNFLIFCNMPTIESGLRAFLRDDIWPGLTTRWLIAGLAFIGWALTWSEGWTYAQRVIGFSVAFLIQLALFLAYVLSLRGAGLRFVQSLLLFATLLVAAALFARMFHILRRMDTVTSWQQDVWLPLQTFTAVFAAFLRVCCVLYLIQHRTEQRLRAAHQDIERRANFDLQTGVMSRSYFEIQVHAAIATAQRQQHPLTLLLLDVDHFKTVNDTFGHQQGDEVLASIGKAVRDNTRSNDLVGRLGGDEFAILLLNMEIDDAIELAERIRTEVASMQTRCGALSLSIGLCGLPPAKNFESAYRLADAALYTAKQAGRGRVVAHDPLKLSHGSLATAGASKACLDPT
ncbi:sensor domain-containing diguanylate cyclase (plasmid) [Cupriavidus sp. P-10]|uniref:GGDEF domain-containing protein n=1 Tax=unclassified Cupriavidus TaxID=2640874 RepID=UPI000E2F2DBD|nr:diguanylate cyclase [Cupriavidus sp. P-10]BDB30583.1 sensor domain-containing diguanylate cyclase [Cupriavidus sp. P-10]